MYKTELIRRGARETRLSQRVVADVVEATQRLIEQALRTGQQVTLPGFGTFYTRKRPAGKVKHVRTGKPIAVPARRIGPFCRSWGKSNGKSIRPPLLALS